MTKDEEQLIANIMHRMHANEQAQLDAALSSARADAVTRAEADRVRIDALAEELLQEREAHAETADILNKTSAQLREAVVQKESDLIEAAHKTAKVLQHREGESLLFTARRVVEERDGLLTQVQDMRAEMERLREDERKAYQAGDALRAEVADLKTQLERLTSWAAKNQAARETLQTELERLKAPPKRSHPVKVGEWVTDGHKARQVRKVFADWYLLRTGHDWKFDRCTPCDPPASDHDTPEGKDVAESVIRDSRKTGPADEIKVGDVVEVFQATGDITATSDIGLRGTVLEIASEDKSVRLKNLTQNKEEWVDMCDVRKVTT